MKKFTKVCLSMAAIIAFVGIIFCSISAAIGGSWNEISEQLEAAGIPENVKDVIKEGVAHSEQLEGGDETQRDTYLLSTDNIGSIHVEADMADIEFMTSEDIDTINVIMKRGYMKHYSCKMDGTVLEINYDTKHNNYRRGPKITIEIPDGVELKEIEVHTALGDIKMDGFTLNTEKLDVHSNLGDIKLTNMTIPGEILAATDLGDIKLLEGSFGKMDLENSMGDIKISGEVTANVKASCSMGTVEAKLSGVETDYNYALETSMGEVEINNRSYKENMQGEANIINTGAAITLTMNSDMGDVEVTTE